MRLRLARAQGVALAGVATAAVFAGGLFFTRSDQRTGGVATHQRALAPLSPHWHDGYNHFVLTVMAPVSTTGRLGPAPSARSGRQARGMVAVAAHSSPTAAGTTPASEALSSSLPPGGTGSEPWQSVAPNPNEPIVLHAGQPISLLPKLLARFPKGTRLVRDRYGNLRAVLPPGSHYGHYHGPAPKGQAPGKAPTRRTGKAATGKSGLPPGWGPDSAAVAASLRRVPGVHSAAPVWGDRYEVSTTLSEAELRSVPGVGAVTPDNLLTPMSMPSTNDPDIAGEYYLANQGQTVQGQAGTSGASADFSYAWSRSGGSGVLIADIDTGVDLSNPDLAGQISPLSENFSVSPPNTDVQAQGEANGFYHGTTVDGVMVGLAGNGWGGAGAAPEAKVLALKCGDSDTFTDSCIYAAGEYAISKGVKVIDMPFGEQVASDPTLQNLISDAKTAGVLVTASAGNWGADNDNNPVLPAGFATTYPNVISVGSTDNQDNLSSFSDYGAGTVDLMAPGTDIFTDYPSYSGYPTAYVSGTSYAAPMVAATAALLWSADSSLSYTQVKNDIISSAQSVPALAGKCVSGARLDAAAALALVGEPVQFTFTGFDNVQPNQAAQVSINVTAQAGALPSGVPLGYHLQLAYNYDGQMYNVVGQQVQWAVGTAQPQTVTTSSDGTAFVAPPGTDASNYGASPIELSLPSPGLAGGTYALVAYAAQASSPGAPIGNPQAVFFNVGQPSPTPAASTTTTASTTTSVAATTTTGAPTSTTVAGATTAPPTSSSVTTTTNPVTSTTNPLTTTSGALPSTTVGAGTGPGMGGATTTTTATGPTTLPSASTTTPGSTTTVPPTSTPTPTSTTPSPTSTTGATGTTGSVTTTTVTPTSTVTSTTGPPTTTVASVSSTTAAPTTTTAAGTGSFSIDSVAPNSLPAGGGDLSIFGNNLPPNPVVMVGAVDAAVSNATSGEVDVMVGPMPSGQYAVTVYNAAQTQSASLSDAVTVGSGGGGGAGTTSTSAVTTTSLTVTTTSSAVTTTGGPAPSTVPTTSLPTTTSLAGTSTSVAPPTTLPATTTTALPSVTTTSTPVTSTSSASTTTGVGAVTTTTAGPGGTVVGPDGMVLAPVAATDTLSGLSVGEWPALTASQLIADNGQSAGSAVSGVDV